MPPRILSHVVAFDDGPFDRRSRGDVPVVGAVYSGLRLEGVVSGRVRKDGVNSTERLAALVSGSRFAGHLQLVMLQGIALGGFNVVDVPTLAGRLGLPVLVVARHAPDLPAIRDALFRRVRGGERKWRLIEALGPMEPVAGVHVQRAGLTLEEAGEVIRRTAVCGLVPEPLRAAHLIAGGAYGGESRGRT